MRRREFITLLGGAAATWPLAARAQQERMRRIGVLMNTGADDPQSPLRLAAFLQGLSELGWIDGRNVGIEYRWGAGYCISSGPAAQPIGPPSWRCFVACAGL